MIELAHRILIHTGSFCDTPIACKSPKDRVVGPFPYMAIHG